MKNMAEKESRRRFLVRGLKAAASIGATAGFLGALEYGARRHDAGLTSIAERKETAEQKEALELFRTLGDENFVRNIVSSGEKEGEHIAPVNLRDRPFVPRDKDDLDAGQVVGKLKPGVLIDKAMAVLGNDRNVPFDRKAEGTWLAFLNPENGKKIVFAYGELFEPLTEVLKAKPVRLND